MILPQEIRPLPVQTDPVGLDGVVDADSFFVVLLFQGHKGFVEIQPHQGGLSPLEGDGAFLPGIVKALLDHRLQGLLRHEAIGAFLPLFHDVPVKAIAAAQIAQPRRGLDQQMDRSHGTDAP